MAGASRTTFTRVASQVRALDTRPLTVVSFVGVTERGPIGSEQLVTSYAEYQSIYGGFTSNSADMDLAVKCFFDEGGKVAHIVRVVHCSSIGDPTTKTSDVGTLTLADRAGTPLDTIQVDGKTDGTYANALSIQIAAPSNGASDAFNLYVLKSGVVVERFVNLVMDSTDPLYFETVINSGSGTQVASNLITVTDLDSATSSPNNRPAVGTAGPLTGGADGLASLADADYTGGTSTGGSTGLRCLDTVEDLSIIVVPGRATSAAQNGVVTYCEVNRGGLCFAILDPPAGQTVAQMRTYVTSTAALAGLTELAAIYYPRIKVDNPNKSVFGNAATVTAPPSGAVAGLCARIDASKDGGAFEHPASIEIGFLRTARGLESDEVKDETKRGLLFDDRINPIMSKKGRPIHVDGARTLKSDGPFPTVGESRGVLFVEQTIQAAVDPKRNRNNTPRLRNEIKMLVEQFLSRLTARGCFASTVDAEAWYVDVSDALNSAAEQAAGNVNARFGIATSKPAEFINFTAAPFAPAATQQFEAA